MVCGDVPEGIADLYRLFLVLWYSDKPVVTGAFTARSTVAMLDLLSAESGGREAMSSRPGRSSTSAPRLRSTGPTSRLTACWSWPKPDAR